MQDYAISKGRTVRNVKPLQVSKDVALAGKWFLPVEKLDNMVLKIYKMLYIFQSRTHT